MRSKAAAGLVFAAVLCLPALSDGADNVGSDCRVKGHQLWGRVQVVDHFADLDVQFVDHFADVHVKWVEHFADKCGRWERVEHFPDVKIRIVDNFPDVKAKRVDHFEGLP